MVKITILGEELHVTGKTYPHREAIKSLGGRWKPDQKFWVVPNTEANLKILKTMKQERRCGWCGELGHFKPKCQSYLDYWRKEELAKAEALRAKPGWKYKKYASVRDDCECGIVDKEIKGLGLTVQVPFTCWGCNHYCCSRVVVCDQQRGHCPTEKNYTCPCSSMTYQERETQRFLNDTSGT